MTKTMSRQLLEAIDFDRYPRSCSCGHCGGVNGDSEELWTGFDGEPDASGFEIWFCCHDCRDACLPCETFYPIRLKPSTQRSY